MIIQRSIFNTPFIHIITDTIYQQWIQHKAKEDNLQKFTESTQVHIINPPRGSAADNTHKPLLVLDLDHTLLDFSSRTLTENGATAMDIGSSDDAVANQLKRPYMDEFLTWAYKYYDLVVWSQTSWKWLEVRAASYQCVLACPLT
jgi:ubiquitin-like domain-containing CTD phosphatase 1